MKRFWLSLADQALERADHARRMASLVTDEDRARDLRMTALSERLRAQRLVRRSYR